MKTFQSNNLQRHSSFMHNNYNGGRFTAYIKSFYMVCRFKVLYHPDFYASSAKVTFVLTPLIDCGLWYVFTNLTAHTHSHCVLVSACLAATGSLAFNTCMPVSPPSLSAASTRRHFVQQAENGVELSPHESTHHGSAGSVFQHFTWIIAALCIEESVFFALPSPSFLLQQALLRPQQQHAAGGIIL